MSPRVLRRRTPRRVPDFHVTGKKVPTDLFPSGEVRFSPGGGSVAEARARLAELRKLVTWRAWDVLAAIKAGALDAGNVAASVKFGGESALAQLRAAAREASAEPAPTVREMAERYVAAYADGGRREAHSVKQIRSRLLGKRAGRGFCAQMVEREHGGGLAEIGSLPFPALEMRPDLIEAAIQRGWQSSSTRESIRTAVSGLFSWELARERRQARSERRPPRWSENPAAQVEEYQRRPRRATAAESQVHALFANAEIHQVAYLRVFLHLGLREDEMIHTRLHLDLHISSWEWRIQGRGPDERHGCIDCRGEGWSPKGSRRKGSRSGRILLLPEHPKGLRGAILQYLEAYPCEPGYFVFRNPRTGQPWNAERLDADFRALCKRAGVTYGRNVAGGITLHDLRATCATRLVEKGVRESVIAELLGDSVQTIVNTYVRLTTKDLADAVSAGPAYSGEY